MSDISDYIKKLGIRARIFGELNKDKIQRTTTELKELMAKFQEIKPGGLLIEVSIQASSLFEKSAPGELQLETVTRRYYVLEKWNKQQFQGGYPLIVTYCLEEARNKKFRPSQLKGLTYIEPLDIRSIIDCYDEFITDKEII